MKKINGKIMEKMKNILEFIFGPNERPSYGGLLSPYDDSTLPSILAIYVFLAELIIISIIINVPLLNTDDILSTPFLLLLILWLVLAVMLIYLMKASWWPLWGIIIALGLNIVLALFVNFCFPLMNIN